MDTLPSDVTFKFHFFSNMQLLVITLVVLAQSVNAFWDAGHMLVGQVAKSYLEPLHYGALEALLQRWDEQFPNTGDLATVWRLFRILNHFARLRFGLIF